MFRMQSKRSLNTVCHNFNVLIIQEKRVNAHFFLLLRALLRAARKGYAGKARISSCRLAVAAGRITYQSSLGLDKRPPGAIHFVIQATCIAQIVACAVASPERRRYRAAIDALAALGEVRVRGRGQLADAGATGSVLGATTNGRAARVAYVTCTLRCVVLRSKCVFRWQMSSRDRHRSREREN